MSKTILIVEDDRSLARMWTELLTAEGFTVVTEKDGEWALKAFEQRQVDFVILDVLVPVRNGFQIAERLRKLPGGADVPILMISGIYRSARHRAQAVASYGVLEYLDKPVRSEKLLSILRAHFGPSYPRSVDVEAERARLDEAPVDRFVTAESHREAAEVEQESRGAGRGARANKGRLEQQPFPELLAELYRWQATGALLLSRGRVKKIVYFKDGYPVFVKSNLLSECLGKVMVRERMITEEQCEDSLARMRASKRQQGTVLLEMGLISPHNLVFALERQLRVKLLDIFGWQAGEWQFTPQSEVPPQTVTLEGSTAAFIHDGVVEKWPVERVRLALGDLADHYVVPAADPLYRYQDMDLDPTEEALVQKISGRRTIRELVELGILDEARTWQLLYALRCAQMVEVRAERARRGEVSHARPPKLPARAPRSGPPPLKTTESSPSLLLPELASLAGAPAMPSAAERGMKERLLGELKEMRKHSYFEILGVARAASTAEIRKAYFALAREYHPDKIAGAMGDEVKQLAGQIYDLITAAHETLANDDTRSRYLDQITTGSKKKAVSDEVSKILAAEGKFQRGEGFLRKGRWADAHKAFQEAVDLYPDEGEFHAYLGWSLFQTAPGDPAVTETALDHINRAVQRNPKVDRAYLFLGYIYKTVGRKDKAEKQFEKAIQVNPDCTEALRELRLFSQFRKGA